MAGEEIPIGRSDIPGEDLPDELASLVQTAVSWTHRRWRTVAGYDGLGYGALSLLHRLLRVGPQSLGELARWEGVTPATISQTADRLLDGGFVTRAAIARDRGGERLKITESGAAAAQHWIDQGVAWIDAALADASDADRETLRRAAHLLVAIART
ncbi:MAG: MarR family transcriptional regulator [Micrococcales bacterium]|nr:MarR family transcriptional regulator [Micrococcales bacterium]